MSKKVGPTLVRVPARPGLSHREAATSYIRRTPQFGLTCGIRPDSQAVAGAFQFLSLDDAPACNQPGVGQTDWEKR